MILKKYPPNWKRSAIIPLLHLAQKQNNNFLPLSAMRKIAKITEVNEMDVYEVATFYTMFNRERVGKFHLQICGTTPCQLRGAEKIIEACEKHLGIKSGQTTNDYMFTIQEVECLGACANAPMLQVNGEWVYEDLTPENTVQLLENLKKGTDKKGPQINRNDCEGPQGRTTLKVFLSLCRMFKPTKKLDLREISLRLSKIGKNLKERDLKQRRKKQNRRKEWNKKEEKLKQKKYDEINITLK